MRELGLLGDPASQGRRTGPQKRTISACYVTVHQCNTQVTARPWLNLHGIAAAHLTGQPRLCQTPIPIDALR